MSREIFTRRELKYLIPFDTYQAIVEDMKPYMRYDRFGDGFGRYNIVSLYFDSPDYTIYYETRNKLNFRQKLRLRVYDNATQESTAFFEVKQKFNNVVNKRRTMLPLKDAYEYVQSNKIKEHYNLSNKQIMNEVDHFKNLYHLHPEVVVSYDRQAFHGVDDADLRVTFDYNLRCRNDDLFIENGPHGNHFVDQNLVVMEVKVNDSVPLWLTRLLSNYKCEKRGVSKYCTSVDTANNANKADKQSVLL
ncbi:polyphosphate polymerase domain-containing protein [Texcoconibacillus texcoconensis]|uniref:VTC domain-containing protein n=1 Tax=Texcoconibacillus texcoconensis TaxID=1095777 RepID=A0A840QR01_9BACI|nr:polyphosphate polymerase domain-containing protein [Texcoconibacillus texcoconensis]MBB5173780.1 hypothetical protein [Texcoconibacillus texcoconensis]